MKRSTQLHIAEPCSQDWAGMQPGAGGRFCGSCQKTVIDFTQMSDAEMLLVITQAAGGCCGRFEAHQLQRPLVLHPGYRVPFRMPLLPAAAVLATWFLLSLPPEAHAQQKKGTTTAQTSIQKKPVAREDALVGEVMKVTTLSGCVTDRETPLANATVLLAGTTLQTKTDAKGHFSLTVPASFNAQSYLLVKVADYEDKKVPIDPRHPDKFLNISLTNVRIITMGFVSAMPAPKPERLVGKVAAVPPSHTMGTPAMIVKDPVKK